MQNLRIKRLIRIYNPRFLKANLKEIESYAGFFFRFPVISIKYFRSRAEFRDELNV